jgi:hypothetical protein
VNDGLDLRVLIHHRVGERAEPDREESGRGLRPAPLAHDALSGR